MGNRVGTGRPMGPRRALWNFRVWIASAVCLETQVNDFISLMIYEPFCVEYTYDLRIFFFLSYRSRSAGSRLRIVSILLSASRFVVSIPLGALERAPVLSPSERSDIGCRYPDPSESIEFPGNSPGKSQVLGCMSTSVASVVWLCCDITIRVKAFNLFYFYLSNYRDRPAQVYDHQTALQSRGKPRS